MVTSAFRTQVLRRSLQVDGLFELIGGAVFVIGFVPIASFIGLALPLLLLVAGVGKLLYGVFLLWLGNKQPINRKTVMLIVLYTGVWIGVTIVLLFIAPLNEAGKWLLGIAAFKGAIFADLQFYGIR